MQLAYLPQVVNILPSLQTVIVLLMILISMCKREVELFPQPKIGPVPAGSRGLSALLTKTDAFVLQNAIDRPASEKKKELSPELAERIRRMRSACNTKARGDSRKNPASKRSYTPSSLSPPTKTPEALEAQLIGDLQNPISSPISGLPLARSNFLPPAQEPDDEICS